MAMNNRLLALFTGLALTLSTSIANAILITVDPDDFADGTDISNAFSGITLSAIDGGNNVILTSSVFSQASSLASTGTQVFGHDGIFTQTWANGLVGDLRIDFLQATDFVSIDIIANNGSDPGFLEAYDSSGTLLDSFVTQGDLGSGTSETASISSASANIAYVIASGLSGNDVGLDNLTYNSATVPEPTVLALLSFGLLGIGIAKRKKV
jgi:hypothetical protein